MFEFGTRTRSPSPKSTSRTPLPPGRCLSTSMPRKLSLPVVVSTVFFVSPSWTYTTSTCLPGGVEAISSLIASPSRTGLPSKFVLMFERRCAERLERRLAPGGARGEGVCGVRLRDDGRRVRVEALRGDVLLDALAQTVAAPAAEAQARDQSRAAVRAVYRAHIFHSHLGLSVFFVHNLLTPARSLSRPRRSAACAMSIRLLERRGCIPRARGLDLSPH